MNATSRRVILQLLVAAGGDIALEKLLLAQNAPHPQPMPSPNAPGNQNAPLGLDSQEIPKTKAPTSAQNWPAIKSDVQKLYSMTTQFKDNIDHVNLGDTLPTQLVKQAHDIEVLAKHIKDRIKG